MTKQGKILSQSDYFGADTADALKLRARNFRGKVARIKLF
jgi:hypothetical protein